MDTNHEQNLNETINIFQNSRTDNTELRAVKSTVNYKTSFISVTGNMNRVFHHNTYLN